MILYDTGTIVAAANTNDQHHHACVSLLTELRLARTRLLIPATVVAEAGYLIRKHSPRSEVEFIRSLSNGDFEPVEITVTDYARMTELTEIACTDRTDFRMVNPQHVDAFTLLPEGIG